MLHTNFTAEYFDLPVCQVKKQGTVTFLIINYSVSIIIFFYKVHENQTRPKYFMLMLITIRKKMSRVNFKRSKTAWKSDKKVKINSLHNSPSSHLRFFV